MDNLYRVPYSTHLTRWNNAVSAEGITTKKPTFHSLRHTFGSRILKLSGGNLKMAQDMMGHADPATTAIYLEVDMADKVAALSKSH